MADDNPRATAKTAAGIVSTVGLVGLVEQYGIGGILYATFIEIIGVIQSAGETITAPFRAFGGGLANVIEAVFPARIMRRAADFTAFTITQGEWAIFGPLTFVVGVIATMLGIWVFMRFLRRMDFSVAATLLRRR